MSSGDGAWVGCHGVRVSSDWDPGLGRLTGDPLLDVSVAVAPVPDRAGLAVWSQSVRADPPLEQRLVDHGDGEYTLEIGGTGRVGISSRRNQIVVKPPLEPLQSQLIASFAIPVLLSARPVLVLHAAAATRQGRTVLVTGPGGAGKSSSLVGLIDSGWLPLTEDVCVIDLSDAAAAPWPGPPWVRLHHGVAGPCDSQVSFRTSEKTAWDLTHCLATGRRQLSEMVVLCPPGGSRPEVERLSSDRAIAALAPHAVWLTDREPGRHIFGPLVMASRRVPVYQVRLPRSRHWLSELTGLMDAGLSVPAGRDR